MVDRITGRRVCSDCGATYAVGRDESAATAMCANCGGDVLQRPDDTEDAVRKRLATYAESTEPLLTWFRERDRWSTSTASATPTTSLRRWWPGSTSAAPVPRGGVVTRRDRPDRGASHSRL